MDIAKALDENSEFSAFESIDSRQSTKSIEPKSNSRNYSNPYANDFSSLRSEQENKQNLINAFMKETGADEKTANFYLDSSSDKDLYSAIELFYKLTKENN